MKNKVTIVILILLIFLMIGAVVLVPKIFPKNSSVEPNSTSVIVSEESEVSSILEKTYTLDEVIAESDNVLLGTVIKADVDENGVLYTLTVKWSDVYKGRNYTTMGYAYVEGLQTLELNQTYLFIGDTNEEKYHYKEPFENAPWVFYIDEETLTNISNGDVNLIVDAEKINLETVKSICKNQTSSK